MRTGHARSIAFKAVVVTFVLLIGVTTTIHSQEGTVGPSSTSVDNLEAVIKTLETPEKREALINDLKALLEAQKRQAEREALAEKKPTSLVEKMSAELAQVAHQASTFFQNLSDFAPRVSAGWKETAGYLLAEKNRAFLYQTISIIGAGVAIALFLTLLARRLTSVLSAGLLRGKAFTGLSRIRAAGLQIIVYVSPYAALLLAAFLVFRFLGIRGTVYQFGTLFFLILFIYESVYHISRILLSPDERGTRVIPLDDENAVYAWIWARRFINLWLIYYAVTEALEILRAPPSLLEGIKRILILLFPIFSTVLLLQIKGLLAGLKKRGHKAGFWRGVQSYAVRFWPLVAGAVVWLVAIFVVTGYEKGILFLGFASVKTVLAVALLWVGLRVVNILFDRLFHLGKEITLRFPGLEEKTNRYIGVARGAVRVVVIVVAIGTILQFWGIRTSWFVTSHLGATILSRVIAIAITIGIVMLLLDLSRFLTQLLVQPQTAEDGRVIEPGRKRKTLVPLFRWLVNVAAIFVGGVIVLGQFGVNVTPILAGAGIVGLAVGFGAQSLVKDFINGLFLLFEDSVAVGDIVVINGTGGLVEAVTLRTIKMRDLAGNVHVIPNGTVDMITNMTKEYSRYVFDVGVAYREDVDEVIDVLKEIGESLHTDPEFKDDILEPLEILGVDQFADSAVVIKARITTKPIKQWRIGREFNRRMKKVFDERGIEIPFPHRTVYWGEPKKGQAPPLSVQLRGEAMSQEKTVD